MLITDFDGTLVHLAVDWGAIRRDLGVQRVSELWDRADPQALQRLAEAERQGARSGADNAEGVALVRRCSQFAVLTDNSETAVAVFFERHPDLGARCRAVVGRETLGGTKRAEEVFRRGVGACLKALGAASAASVTYLGDADYELSLARELGFARVTRVTGPE